MGKSAKLGGMAKGIRVVQRARSGYTSDESLGTEMRFWRGTHCPLPELPCLAEARLRPEILFEGLCGILGLVQSGEAPAKRPVAPPGQTYADPTRVPTGHRRRPRSESVPVASEAPGFVGPYRLLNVVHTGQTSQIWQAYHDGKQQRFGIKTLLEKFRRDREQVGYLRWEFAVAESMEHERVIRVHEFDVDRGTPYLATEWFPAPNMKFFLQHNAERLAYLIPKSSSRRPRDWPTSTASAGSTATSSRTTSW